MLHDFRLGIDNIACPACRCVCCPCPPSLILPVWMQCDLLCSWAGGICLSLVADLAVLRQPFHFLALAHPYVLYHLILCRLYCTNIIIMGNRAAAEYKQRCVLSASSASLSRAAQTIVATITNLQSLQLCQIMPCGDPPIPPPGATWASTENSPLLCISAPRSGHPLAIWLIARSGHPTVPPTFSARLGHPWVAPRSRSAPDQAIQGPPRSRSTNTLSAGSRRSCQGGLVTV